jgi:hypothetical protein
MVIANTGLHACIAVLDHRCGKQHAEVRGKLTKEREESGPETAGHFWEEDAMLHLDIFTGHRRTLELLVIRVC